jgi:hypothetical protein
MAKKPRRPGTWPTIKIHRGPDKATDWAGPAFTIKSRSSAAKQTDNLTYADLFSSLKPRTITLGPRHQTTEKFVVQKLRDTGDTKLKLFISRDKFIFVRENLTDKTRFFSASIIYPTRERALQVYKNNNITFIEFSSVPID